MSMPASWYDRRAQGWMLPALTMSVTLAGVACVPNPNEPGDPIRITTQVAQPGGNASRTAWGAEGPLPPLERVWTFSSESDGYSGFGAPVVADGLVYVTSDKLYAVDRTGREAWSFDPEIEDGYLSEPVLQGEDVLVAYVRGMRVGIVAVDRATHERSWSWASSAATRGTGGIWLNVDGEHVFLAAQGAGTNLWVVESGGREVWSAEAERRPGSLYHTLPSAIADGVVVVVTGRSLEARSMADGSILWRKERGFHEIPAITHGLVLTTTFTRTAAEYLNVFDLESGRRIRRLPRVLRFAIEGEHVWTFRGGRQELGESPEPPRFELRRLPSLTRISWTSANPFDEVREMLPVAEGVLALESRRFGFHLARYELGSGRTSEQELPDHDPGIPGLDADPSSMTSTGGAILVTTGIGILYAYAPVGEGT